MYLHVKNKFGVGTYSLREKATKMEILTYILAVWQNSEVGSV